MINFFFQYCSSGFTEANVTSSEYYRYFALVINRLIGSEHVLNFDEWHIYGKEKTVSETDLPEHRLLTFNTIISPNFNLTFNTNTI